MSDIGTRERILHAAAQLLAESGGAPISTRAVCAAAGVGAPTLYHHFGDKDGLLDAVVAYGYDRYLEGKRSRPSSGDPVEDLRRGWDAHVEFGLTHPAFYALMHGAGRRAAASREGYQILLGETEAVARAGRLRVPVRAAADMLHAASVGVTLKLISGDEPDPELSPRTREAILAAVTTDQPEERPSSVSGMAIALTAALEGRTPRTLSEAESALLREWLTRLAVE
ncbi:TetR/AcrR family transcriptional regulator [Actinoallomurus iriomotensis]|uniref:TetR family transcriptional regulator n=1 Tax=Actinoallomurus iriomotensis TaxID=478107 RepID=A0A9W6VS69_9ACTN|nr:TetR/AcrR family transcriptional regulator [Actinoallomurus iriomotensis]GLY76326.1 TetR family transcriptional regulator [Actinoallomurus iriomotensis]